MQAHVGRYTYIIWDWNGTLFDDARLCVEVMNAALAKRNLPSLTLARYQEILEFPIVNYYRSLGFDFTVEPFETAATEFIEEYYRRWPECGLVPGAAEALREISGLGCRQAILSAAPHGFLIQAVEFFGIAGYFAAVSGLDDHYARSKIGNGRKLVSKSGVPAKEILLVGDTEHDHEVSQAIGVDCALIPGKHCSRKRLTSCGGMLIDSVGDVVRMVADGRHVPEVIVGMKKKGAQENSPAT